MKLINVSDSALQQFWKALTNVIVLPTGQTAQFDVSFGGLADNTGLLNSQEVDVTSATDCSAMFVIF